MQEYLEVGKIVNTHGVKGELKIIPLTDDPERFKMLDWVYMDDNKSLSKLNIDGVKFFKEFVILKFKEINDLDSAERLKGFYLKVHRDNAVKLPKDSYFICDLIDCEVFEESGKKLGVIKDIIKTGSNDVYIVSDDDKKEILIPALKSIVKKIDINEKEIIVELPEEIREDEI